MGVGKTALGHRLARELKFRFLDSDREIERAEGKSVAEIFAESGEAAFRELERRFIDTGHPANGCVVSCGGGLVVPEGMSERLKSKGVVICLFASPETIIERTSRNQNRPLLNVPDPEAKIRQLLEERQPIYMSCGTCITTENRSLSEVLSHAVRCYRSSAKKWRPPETA
jgi:shikimate kinase